MVKAFDPKVFQLGYVAMESADLERGVAHYAQTMGMAETARGHDGEAYLSMGYEHHNIVLRKAEQKAFSHLGYQLNPGIDLDAFARTLADAGLTPARKSDSQPGVADLVEVEVTPGHLLQFYTEIATPKPGFSGRGIAPLRLGHVAVICSDAPRLRRFYDEVLGFWFTDDIAGLAHFYTCNRDHHVVNILGMPENRIHHIAFQLQENGDHSKASDVLRRAEMPVLWGPSRHSAGHNIASYHYDPEKVMIELYTDMDVFVPEMGCCEPRPWHEDLPMTPRSWGVEVMSAWRTDFAFNLAAG